MKITKANYLTSVVDKNNILKTEFLEFAVVGRSNVGKSSFINCLTNQKKLVKTSSTPGRTRMINYFMINDKFFIVDLPGYGYSQSGKQHINIWATLMEEYLVLSEKLKMVFMLVDIRHKPTDLDIAMQKFLFLKNIPYVVVANKLDKIPKSKINTYKQQIATSLSLGVNNIIEFSSETAHNRETILQIIENNL